MQNDFIREFKELYEATYALYKKPRDPEPNPIVFELFYESVHTYGFESVKKAFSIHIQSPDSGKWMPKPADIVRIISGTSKDNSQLAWSKVKKSISSVGSYETVCFDDPIINRVVQDMGGWIDLCSCSVDELPFKGNEFKTRYSAYKSQGEIPDYPAKLFGICESENSSKRLEIPETILIGDTEKAKYVLSVGSNRKSLQINTNNGLEQLTNKITKLIE